MERESNNTNVFRQKKDKLSFGFYKNNNKTTKRAIKRIRIYIYTI